MKVTIQMGTQDIIEVTARVFANRSELEKFIRALEAAKKLVWPIVGAKK